jgi:esterase/lipase superfamily enzyme/nucleoid DNA-binding protein
MTRRDLIALLADRLRLPRKTVQAMLAELERLAGSELRKGREFEIPDLVQLSVRRPKARMGRNPATGRAIESLSPTIAASVRMKTPAPTVKAPTRRVSGAPLKPGGAIPSPPAPDFTRAEPPEHKGQIVRVHYGTDRQPAKQDGYFAEVRGEELSVGWCDVAIPKDHRLAVVERPSWAVGNWRENPDKHFVIVERRRESDPESFWRGLKDAGRSSALVFIHGFNVGFDDAVYRTAQISYDLEFPGTTLLYSWTSNGSVVRYSSDIENNDFTVPTLKDFLTSVANDGGFDDVHVIAHSMGNRALINALYELALEKRVLNAQLHNVVLTAPDIDAGVFLKLAATMARIAARTTLYASKNDRALKLSMKKAKYRRAGDATKIVISVGVDSVDASSVDTDFLGHSYYGDSTTVLSDIYYVVKKSLPPGDRFGMRPAPRNSPTHWEFRPAR